MGPSSSFFPAALCHLSWGAVNHTILPADSISIEDPGRPDATIDPNEVRPDVATLDLSPQEEFGSMPSILVEFGNHSDPYSALIVGAVRIGGVNVDEVTIMVFDNEEHWEIVAWNQAASGDFVFETPKMLFKIRIFLAGFPMDGAPLFTDLYVDIYGCWSGKHAT